MLAGHGPPRRLATGLREALAAALPPSAAAAVGPPVGALDGLPRSVEEARLVPPVAGRVDPRTRVADAAALGVERALLRAYDGEELRAYVHEQLGPLIDSDDARGTRLLETLKAVLTAAGGKAEAARRLHLRRQTLYQRLRRVGELLDVDVDEPRARAALLLALRARRLLPADGMRHSAGRRDTREGL